MIWFDADKHETETGDLGIMSKAQGLFYFAKQGKVKPRHGCLGIAGESGITYLTKGQLKMLAHELPEIIEEYC